ncbi:DUF4271 domain-containing protein [Hymenobacter sp. DG25A]|uniref:DUF4271 domain-containing protein n=1 Tax=Hymenobacter sp. DG25A TaxID=1385663 RepID=UPI0006BC823A|nr:DUF4271 domain-containing protein [Hymenobacter sp. DG25A]ALD21935.1 hypothetical protein AM218_12865 [Hymenobacter sp. DG25A]
MPTGRHRWWWAVAVGILLLGRTALAAEYRPLPPAPQKGLTNDWLIYNPAQNRLTLYLPDYHAPAHAYYQWVSLKSGQPVPITFTARQNLSLFLDNRLVFTAPESGVFSLDLARLIPAGSPAARHLLCIWHPDESPTYTSFVNAVPQPAIQKGRAANALLPQERVPGPQNVYIVFLLLIGLGYGSIRATYRPGFTRIYQLSNFWSKSSTDQDFLIKPTITWLNLVLVLVFSLSFALLLVAIHTSVQNVPIIRRIFNVPESALVVRVLLYTGLIAAFVLLKYLYLQVMGYIFDVSGLVMVQYREFIRTILLMGLVLPFVMLLYLALNSSAPSMVLWVSNGVVTLLLLVTVLRIGRTLNQRTPLLNLHLFSYLCATEVLPFIVLLKIIVFPY